jgi:hypothetical protein
MSPLLPLLSHSLIEILQLLFYEVSHHIIVEDLVDAGGWAHWNCAELLGHIFILLLFELLGRGVSQLRLSHKYLIYQVSLLKLDLQLSIDYALDGLLETNFLSGVVLIESVNVWGKGVILLSDSSIGIGDALLLIGLLQSRVLYEFQCIRH